MKIIALFTLLFVTLQVVGQVASPPESKPCSPADINLTGLKLGDTRASIEKAVIPEKNEYTWLFLNPRAASFRDVRLVQPSYDFDGKAFELRLEYRYPTVKWENEEKLAKALSEIWKIPYASWTFDAPYEGVMKCGKVIIKIRVLVSSAITITDTDRKKLFDAEYSRREEERRRVFKP